MFYVLVNSGSFFSVFFKKPCNHICPTDCLITSPGSSTVTTSQLILSGGEGYVNFRIGELKENNTVVSVCLKLLSVFD